MILSDSQILKEIESGEIIIEPFDIKNLGSNSYDIHLGKYIATYQENELDPKEELHLIYYKIPETGMMLMPRNFYLSITQEYTKTGNKLVPNIDGKSSIGRLGIFVHVTAGRGDAGFEGYWTLEIAVIKPVIVYSGMPIGQLSYNRIEGKVIKSYDKKVNAKYQNKNPKPIPSMMYKNWNEKEKKWF